MGKHQGRRQVEINPSPSRHQQGFLPVEFGQSQAKSSNRISLSQFIVREWILNICVRLSKSGRPNLTLRSNCPGRRSAGSSVSGLKKEANEIQKH